MTKSPCAALECTEGAGLFLLAGTRTRRLSRPGAELQGDQGRRSVRMGVPTGDRRNEKSRDSSIEDNFKTEKNQAEKALAFLLRMRYNAGRKGCGSGRGCGTGIGGPLKGNGGR